MEAQGWSASSRKWVLRECGFCHSRSCSPYLFSLHQVLNSSNVRTQEPPSLATRFMTEAILQGALCPSAVTLGTACGAVRNCCVSAESAEPGTGLSPPVLVGGLLFTLVACLAGGTRAQPCPQKCNAGERGEGGESIRKEEVELLPGFQGYLEQAPRFR